MSPIKDVGILHGQLQNVLAAKSELQALESSGSLRLRRRDNIYVVRVNSEERRR
jgi:hypothetical protein